MFGQNPVHFAVRSVFVFVGFMTLAAITEANMSYTPWIHNMVQNGTDMEITVAIFEETEATNEEGEPIPDLSDGYTLSCMSPEGGGVVFEDRVFEPDEADEVTEKICHIWDYWNYYYYVDPEQEIPCEDDSDCEYGFCAVAYRYIVSHHCPPFESDMRYQVHTTSNYDLLYEGEGLGMSNWYEGELTDMAECQDTGGCSTSGAGALRNQPTLLGALLGIL